jgi:DNA topoisomerase-2
MRVLGAAAAAKLCAPAAAIARSRGLVRGDRSLAKQLLCATQGAALWQSRPATWLTVSPGTAHGGGRRLVTSAAQQASEDEAMRYEMKTQVEHVLHRPDVYVGSMETTERQMLVYNVKTRQAEFRPVKYVPGLLKLFDEIIVNAADNKIRDPSMDRIEVTIDEKRNVISVWNNGKGIPVIRHA